MKNLPEGTFVNFILQRNARCSFIILSTCYLLATPLFAYSLFSGAGLGEPIYTSPKTYEFGISEDLSFECSFRGEFISSIKGEKESQFFNFTFPYFSYFLPLPKKAGIELSLSELLNLNYEIEGDTVQYGVDEVMNMVKSKGSANAFNIGIGKNMAHISFMAGNTNIIRLEAVVLNILKIKTNVLKIKTFYS